MDLTKPQNLFFVLLAAVLALVAGVLVVTAQTTAPNFPKLIDIRDSKEGPDVLLRGTTLEAISGDTLELKIFGYAFKAHIMSGAKVLERGWGKSETARFDVGDTINVWGIADSSDPFLIHAKVVRNVTFAGSERIGLKPPILVGPPVPATSTCGGIVPGTNSCWVPCTVPGSAAKQCWPGTNVGINVSPLGSWMVRTSGGVYGPAVEGQYLYCLLPWANESMFNEAQRKVNISGMAPARDAVCK